MSDPYTRTCCLPHIQLSVGIASNEAGGGLFACSSHVSRSINSCVLRRGKVCRRGPPSVRVQTTRGSLRFIVLVHRNISCLRCFGRVHLTHTAIDLSFLALADRLLTRRGVRPLPSSYRPAVPAAPTSPPDDARRSYGCIYVHTTTPNGAPWRFFRPRLNAGLLEGNLVSCGWIRPHPDDSTVVRIVLRIARLAPD